MPEVKKILVVRFSSFGDIVLTLPVIQALKVEFPDSRIFFLTKKRYKSLVSWNPLIDSVIEFDSEGKHKNLYGFLKFIRELKSYKFDLLIDLHSNPRSFLIRKLVNAQRKLKYKKRWLARFSMVRFKFLKIKSKHTVDCYLDLLKKIDVEAEDRLPRFHLRGEDRDFASDFLRKKGLKDIEILVGMAPQARWKTKAWDKEKFSYVGNMILKKYRSRILLVGDESEKERLVYISSELKEKNVIYALDFPFNRLAGVIKSCEVFITNDSGPMHLSSALGVPTIAIFGPTHPKLGFSPLGLMDKVVTTNEWCSPCSLHGKKKCFRDKRYCMDKITPEEVYKLVEDILNSQKVVFLDRDGTIIEDRNFLSRTQQVSFFTGSVDAIRILKSLGYKLIVITNQSGINRGLITLEDVNEVNRFILDELKKKNAAIDDVYFCPHHPDEGCSCRKPQMGLVEKAKEKHKLNLSDSVVIGDKLSDVILGKKMFAKTVLVLTGYGKKELEKIKDSKEPNQKPDFVAKDILDAALWLKKNLSDKDYDIKNT